MCRKLVVFLVSLSVAVVFCSSAIAQVSPPSVAPIHEWLMDEGAGVIGQPGNTVGPTTPDSGTPGGHDGTIFGLSWAAGLNGSPSALDHEREDWGEAVDIPTLAGQITGDFTIEAWIKAESWAESWQGPIFANLMHNPAVGAFGQNYGFNLRAGARNDQAGWDPTKAVLGFVIAGEGTIWQDQDSLASGIFMDLNTEYHVMGTYNAVDGTMAIYIDGVLAGQRTHLPAFQDSAQVSEIGRSPLSTQRFDGIIDEVKLYDVFVPEPATLSLLGLGALGLLRKRKR